MEMLNAYIRDLLFLHDCVILPDLGGFVTNYKSAKKTDNDYFAPPRKVIAFNPQLQHNDGLLANTIVAIEKIDYDQAMQRISAYIEMIKKELRAKGEYTIPTVGTIKNGEEQRILFSPDTTTNFWGAPIGMATFHMMPLSNQQPVAAQRESKKPLLIMPILRRVLVAGVSGFALLSLILNPGKFENLTLSSLAPTGFQEQGTFNTAEHATAPAIEKMSETKQEIVQETATEKALIEQNTVSIVKKYHVMVGCFAMRENAERKGASLAKENITANVFRYDEKLTGVSVGSFETFEKAKVLMDELRNTGKAPSAWVLKRVLK